MIRYMVGLCLFSVTAMLGQLSIPTRGNWAARSVSPDGRYVLFGVAVKEGVTKGPQFWFQDNASGKKTLLIELGRTLSAFWSPDSSAFAVNDEYASDGTNAYIYDVHTLKRMDVGEKILGAYPADKKFSRGHA